MVTILRPCQLEVCAQLQVRMCRATNLSVVGGGQKRACWVRQQFQGEGRKGRPVSQTGRERKTRSAHTRDLDLGRDIWGTPLRWSDFLTPHAHSQQQLQKEITEEKGRAFDLAIPEEGRRAKRFPLGQCRYLVCFFCPTMLQSPCSLPTGCMLAARPPHVEFTWLSPSQAGR